MKIYLSYIENIRYHMQNVWSLNSLVIRLTQENDLVGLSQGDAASLADLQNKCIWGKIFIEQKALEMLTSIRTEIGAGIFNRNSNKEKTEFTAGVTQRLNTLLANFKELFHNTDLSKKTLCCKITTETDLNPMTENFTAYDLVAQIENYLNALRFTVNEEIGGSNTPTDTVQNISPIEEILLPLSGLWQNVKIMKPAEYERLVLYSQHIVDTNTLPTKITPITKGFSTLPLDFYRHTFYRLWKANDNGTNRSVWTKFLKKVLPHHFKNQSIDTINKKFSTYPGSYDIDKESIT